MYETVFHELAHASHFNKVGAGFWDNYINYIVNEGSYGDGTAKDYGLVALSEAWGFHIGWYLTQQKYGVNAIVSVNASERFIPLKRGDASKDIYRIKDLSTGAILRYEGWIPAGIFHDLMDNAADVIRTEYTEDKIRKDYIDYAGTFTNQEFFKCMEKDVRTPQNFRDRLMLKTSNRDQIDVNNLFEAYYFN